MSATTWNSSIQTQALVRRAICFTLRGQRLRIQIQALPGLHRLATGTDYVWKGTHFAVYALLPRHHRFTPYHRGICLYAGSSWEEAREAIVAADRSINTTPPALCRFLEKERLAEQTMMEVDPCQSNMIP